MASTYLNKTLGSGNTDKWTFSCWVKRHNVGVIHPLFHADDGSSNYYTHISFHDTDQLFFQNRWNNGNDGYKITTRFFRDTNAWYHLQFVWDSGNATADDRQIIYVNGERLTGFSGANVAVTQNRNATINDAYEHRIGRGGSFNGSAYGDVTMTHIHFADGQAYAPTVFGEADSTSGIWKPKTSPSVTYGTNGFFLKFANSGSLGLDSSGNTNNFTVNGTGTQTKDTPSNNFATGNPLVMNPSYTGTFSNGNNKLVTSASGKEILVSTLAVSSGKWYAEYKAENVGGGTMIGVIPYEVVVNTLRQNNYLGQDNGSVSMLNTTGAVYNPPTNSGITGVTYTSGDIIGVAVDLDNSYCYFHKNGTYINSGDPTSGATGTGGVPFTKGDSFWCFAGGDSTDAGGSIATISANFGNGYFGTTAVASSNSDSAGLGSFEYAVPSGYYALCTKNIKEFG